MLFININDKYNIISYIDKGTFGTVYKVIDRKTLKTYAMKISYFKENLIINPMILREISILNMITHNNIIKLYDVVIGFYNKKKCIGLLLDLCDYTLEAYINSSINNSIHIPMQESSRRMTKIFMKIIESVIHLHQNNIYHGDLSFNNIMIKNDKIKIIDFGNANRNYRKYDHVLTIINNDLNNQNKEICIDISNLYYMLQILSQMNKLEENDNNKLLLVLTNNKDTYNNFLKIINTNNYKNSIYNLLNDDIKLNLLTFLNDFSQMNNLEDEIIYLTILNSKHINYKNKYRNISNNSLNTIYIILFWLSNKIISIKILGLDTIRDIMIHFNSYTDEIESLYLNILIDLNFHIDKGSLYNFINYVPDAYRQYYKSLILSIELTNYEYVNNLYVLSAIYSIFKEYFNTNFDKLKKVINQFISPQSDILKEDLKSHILNVLTDKSNFINKYYEYNKNFDVITWLNELCH